MSCYTRTLSSSNKIMKLLSNHFLYIIALLLMALYLLVLIYNNTVTLDQRKEIIASTVKQEFENERQNYKFIPVEYED